jgi:protein-S-isoprenylcysteine O-methyltransferase Ste14
MKKDTILPPTYFYSAILVMIVLHFVIPLVQIISFPINLVGIVPIVFGGVLNIRADNLFKKRSTTVKPFEKPSAFLVEGPFVWCRHPMYLGMTSILAGAAIICGSVTSFIGPLAFWLIMRLRFIPAEEKAMLDAFGDDYMRYKGRVHSWI